MNFLFHSIHSEFIEFNEFNEFNALNELNTIGTSGMFLCSYSQVRNVMSHFQQMSKNIDNYN